MATKYITAGEAIIIQSTDILITQKPRIYIKSDQFVVPTGNSEAPVLQDQTLAIGFKQKSQLWNATTTLPQIFKRGFEAVSDQVLTRMHLQTHVMPTAAANTLNVVVLKNDVLMGIYPIIQPYGPLPTGLLSVANPINLFGPNDEVKIGFSNEGPPVTIDFFEVSFV